MSTEEDKFKHSKRIHQKKTKVENRWSMDKNTKLRGTDSSDPYYKQEEATKHRFDKTSIWTCGSSHCVMCGNPRKVWGDLTVQERALFQEKLHMEE